MAVPKVLGTETEFGIMVRNATDFNPSLASAMVVNSVASALRKITWSYDGEQPRRDARETHIESFAADYEAAAVNTVLGNGARFYVDHAHPEYSSPEAANPRTAALYDVAGEAVAVAATATAQRLLGDGEVMSLYKNNSDGKGNSYGYHENVLLDRALPFSRIVEALPTFLVTRQIISGSGKVGAEAGREAVDYQLSQRADFFEEIVGLETTLKRPIVNTRDEPHADSRYRRLHVIFSDATRSETQTYVKLGILALFLAALEDGALPDTLALSDPVSAVRTVSRDLEMQSVLSLADGRAMRAIELQWIYHGWLSTYAEEAGLTEAYGPVLAGWEELLADLEVGWEQVADRLDWAAKLRLITGYVGRGVAWDHPKLRAIDLQYHDIHPDRSLYRRLVERGAMRRVFTDGEIADAVRTPPSDTRAYFRGRCVQKFGSDLVAANWDSLIFDDHQGHFKRVPMMDPLRGTSRHVSGLLDAADDVTSLLDALQGGGE